MKKHLRVFNIEISALLLLFILFLFPAAPVQGASDFKLNYDEISIAVGKSKALAVDFAGENKISWSSSNDGVASVTPAGKVTGKKGGSAFITAKVAGQRLKCRVTVKSLQMKKSSMIMQKGSSVSLKLSRKNISGKVIWSASDGKVAAVNGKGRVTGKKRGVVTITAKADGCTATCRIRVVKASLSATKISIVKGKTKALSISGTSKKPAWSSSRPSVASVDKTGKITAKKKGTAVITAAIDSIALTCKVTVTYPVWNKRMDQYQNKSGVKQLLFVKYTGGSRANVLLYTKVKKKWKKVLSCPGYVGSGGIGEAREWAPITPSGTYTLTSGFGILPNPGAKTPYLQVNQNHYWCSDEAYYNQLIDISQKPHNCSGEHLIDYAPSYNYGMFLDYNKECVYPKGSAIFLHCSGNYAYTGGCIAVSQPDMIKILQTVEKGAKICIYNK